MRIEIINTGTELMLGRVLNTHQQWLCGQLADLGFIVARQVAVADRAEAITAALKDAFTAADLVITTGGLGPTSDDQTRDAVAQLLGRKLKEDPAVLERIASFFAVRKRPMPERTRVQAMIPEGAIVLPNTNGTAPGLILKLDPNPFREKGEANWLVLLPGPPNELRPMFSNQVVRWLLATLPVESPFACRTLLTTGIGESLVEERISGPLEPLIKAGLELGYCARPGEVDLRLAARGKAAVDLIDRADKIVRQIIGDHVFGEEHDNLESVVVRLLRERKQTLVAAESCTGGCVSHRITNVPGASNVFVSGLVTYSNEAKRLCLGVRAETLRAHGAVSEPVAREMAEGARAVFNVDFALATTGIAGPSGGTPEKPVGTVFIALATKARTIVLNRVNAYDRLTFKHVTSQQALDLLRRALSER